MAPAIPLVFLTFLMPESPRWLMMQGERCDGPLSNGPDSVSARLAGREEEALRNLAKLHARGNINDPFVIGEMAEMRAKIDEERGQSAGWSQIFGNKHNMRKIFMGIVVQFSVQMTGISAIQYYSPWVP